MNLKSWVVKALRSFQESHTTEDSLKFARIAEDFEFLASTGSDYHGPGISYREMGSLPKIPETCIPIWKSWNEVNALLN
jgi:3',5'-nucleoside bisphosphate phosphatase